MRPPSGRNVEVEGAMVPVGSSWTGALLYCAVTFGALWFAIFVWRSTPFILIAGLFAAGGFAYLYKATRATLDGRSFGAMRLRAAAVPAAVGGRFTGSLRISESAAVAGTVRAELRCVLVWFETGRRESVAWAEERSFPIRRQEGGSYAILEFAIPPDLPASEAPPVALNAERGRHFARWEIQAVAESDGAYRDELYTVQVVPGKAAPARGGSGADLPMEIQPRAPRQEMAAAPPTAAAAPAAAPLEIARAAAPAARPARLVETVQDLAEPEVLPPRAPDRAAIALLVVANLVPLAGVAFWGWKVQQVVALYWMENLVIGGFNVLRILASSPAASPSPEGRVPPGGKIGLALFFAIHYGGFCFVHGQFLASFFGRGADGMHLGLGGMVLHMLRDPVVAVALLAMLVSHGWSFFRNYLGRGEYQHAHGGELMMQPYRRIIVTHMFIIIGGFLLFSTRSQVLPMMLFVGLKAGFDLYFHLREHRRQSAP